MQATQVKYDTATEELKEYRQWVAWQYGPETSNGKRQKQPISPYTLEPASATAVKSTYEDAYFASGAMTNRLGFVLTADDPFTVIDLDECIVDGEIMRWAIEIVEALDSYTEVSPSGTGLHVWVKAEKPGPRVSTGYETGKIEIFEDKHYVTFTGRQFGDSSRIEERQREIEALYNRLFPDTSEKKSINTGVADGGFTGDDHKLLDKARNANRTGELFAMLYDRGYWQGKYKSQSEADEALCGMLAFWTGCDEERMDRLFRSSALAATLDRKRNPDNYLELTITKAIKGCNNVYDPKTYKTKVTNDLHTQLQGCLQLVLTGDWSGQVGGTDRDVYKVLINTGLMHGKVTANGVVVSASVRTLAKKSGISSRKTVRNALKRLQENRGLIAKLEDGTSKRATTYLIRLTQDDPKKTVLIVVGST